MSDQPDSQKIICKECDFKIPVKDVIRPENLELNAEWQGDFCPKCGAEIAPPTLTPID